LEFGLDVVEITQARTQFREKMFPRTETAVRAKASFIWAFFPERKVPCFLFHQRSTGKDSTAGKTRQV
jgi:hypothetical protein